MSAPAVALRRGPHRLGIAPAGGRVLVFWSETNAGPRHWLRPTAREDAAPVDSASFPMVPFSNRIGDGRFTFAGRTVQMPRNNPPEPHAIHGIGWERDWAVAEAGADRAVLVLACRGDGGWPWPFTATMEMALRDDGMAMSLAVRNDAEEAMPAGVGLHPYFPAPDGTRLRLRATGFLLRDAAGLPERLDPDHPTLAALRAGGTPPRPTDTGLEGWDGQARLDWAEDGAGLDLLAPGVSRLTYFAPAGEQFLCLEPVSHVINAFNRLPAGLAGDGGLRILAPGESLAVAMQIRVQMPL